MLSSINIGGKELQLIANAATPYLYKQTFNKDIMKIFASVTADSNLEEQAELTSVIPEIAYVMAKQAEGLKPSEFMKLKEDDFLEWLYDFSAMDFNVHAGEIMEVYMNTQKTSVNSKKKGN